jgi:RimJ/RimL family protein N-acetyltransferase
MIDVPHERIESSRLALVPVNRETARAILAGEFDSLPHAAGWPHDDTADAMRIMLDERRPSLGWLITVDGLLIGECGTVGWVDDDGDVDVGIGLAVDQRSRGYGTEALGALADWLRRQPGVRRVVANGVEATNLVSRRMLERVGFALEREAGGRVWYALG